MRSRGRTASLADHPGLQVVGIPPGGYRTDGGADACGKKRATAHRDRYASFMSGNTVSIRVNRAPVLTLWAAVLAERLGYPPETALSLASAVAGTAAHAKARRLGLAGDHGRPAPADGMEHARPPRMVRLLGRDVPVVEVQGGGLLAASGDGKPAAAGPVATYLKRAFGDRLPDARAAMEALAATLPPEELNRVGFRLYEQFRPEVPEGVKGWGAKGELRLDRIRGARA